jgi:response regulator RpfG family c-di-GMP phosphodiesterase
MNVLISDNEHLSLNLINEFLSEFYHVTLITSNELTISSSTFLSTKQGDINNANQAIENLSQHENDPFDAILIFNLSLTTGLSNVIQTLKRLKRKPPRIFLIFVNQQNEIDKNTDKLLKEFSKFIQWTIIFCNEINSSTSTKYQIEKKSNPTNQEPISATNFLNFLRDELKLKKYINDIVYLY